MNNTMIRVLSLALCLMMVLALTACGSSGQGSAPAQETQSAQSTQNTQTSQSGGTSSSAASEYAWKSSFLPIVREDNDTPIQPILFTDDGVYASGQVTLGRREASEGEVEEYEGQFNIYGSMLYFITKDGKLEALPKYVPVPPMANPENYKDFYSYQNLGTPIVNADGNLMLLQMEGAGWFEGPESVYGTEEQYTGDYYHNEQNYDVVILSPEGEELSRAPVDLDTTNTWLNTYNIAKDPDGNLIVVMEMTLQAIAPDGSIAWSMQLDNYVNSMVTLADGSVAVMLFGDKGPELRPIDFEKKELGESFPIPDSAWTLFPGDENYDFYYTSGMFLYGFKLGEAEPVPVLNWMSCDINGDSVASQALKISSDGSIMGITTDYSGGSIDTQLFTLTRVPADSLPKKQILTVAQLEYNPDYQLTNRMVRFNRSHDNVRLEYLDYSQYNTESDFTAGITKFNTEVMAGNLPDIIPTNQIAYRQIASKGLLEDLYPYLDKDPELKREDFFPNLLSALEVNGGLYQVVSGFSVETLCGAASIVGDTPGWTYDDFNAALEKMPEGCTPLEPYVTRDQVMSSLLYADMDSFVDWTTGKVNFESDNFKQLLQFVKQFPAEYNWDEHDNSESTQDLLRQGRQMLTQTYLYGLDSILWNGANFGGQATYIGWPTSSGVGSIMRFENGFAMSRSCADKDAAWEFFRSMLTESGQTNQYNIPSNRNVFNKQLEDFMTPRYRKDADGNILLDENGEKIEESRGGWIDDSGVEHHIYAMTQEQADEVLSIIETCTKVASYDTSIYDIVNEQAQAFFADQKSVDEVARLIQSKANIYVNEQR
ncbi:MAG: extracellular solute-binding protein [Oscillospiraceae bacterium]|nr:extracellular solute-binding protein [Oscillospiraceae bacterium]